MQTKEDSILTTFLQGLHFDEKQTRIFVALFHTGGISLLDLSRKTSIPRSTLYRLIEPLIKRGVIEEVVEEYRSLYQACPLEHLEQLMIDQKEQIRSLERLIPHLKTMGVEKTVTQPETKVVLYRGREGIRQMVWNVLSAKEEVVGYTYRMLDEFVGAKFMSRWREEFQKRGIKGRDLLSHEYVKSSLGQKNEPDWNGWETRMLQGEQLSIDHQMDIYDDTVSIYSWHEGEVFGVEVHNAKVARMQFQVFELLWKIAKKIG